MNKRTKSIDDRKLMDRLTPDPALGRLLGIVATTYEMQPEFFETDFLPALLGLGGWDDRTWTSRVALEKHLAELDAASILLDARPYRGRPRSLRVEVTPVLLPAGRILHAKVLIGVYEEAVRLLVGSANLTEPGFRLNREIACVLKASAEQPAESQLVRTAVRGLRTLLGRWISPGAAQLLKATEERLNQWAGDAPEREHWFASSGGPVPLWRQVIDRWPAGEAVERITIVSPFWSEEGAEPVKALIEALRSRSVLGPQSELRLLTDAAREGQASYKPKLPASFETFDASSLGVSASALAVDPRVPPEEVGMEDGFAGTRSLHAKLVLLEGAETSLAFFGSANFTHRGWGFLPLPQQANIEAGLIVRRSGAARSGLRNLIPATTGAPVPLAGAAQGRLAPPEPSPEELRWPAFVREVLLVPSAADANQLELAIVIEPQAVYGPWRMEHLPGDSEPSSPALLLQGGAGSGDDRVLVSLTSPQLERILREQEVHVRWWGCDEGRSFPVNVDAAARTALPISPGSGRPGEQHLIAYYQGRITWEDLFPDPDEGRVQPGTDSQEHELSGVDTSRIQSYIVREFVEALQGISDDLRGAAQSPPACMRLALLGSVSPLALARRVLESAEAGDRTPTASAFQLVEILACLEAARSFPASSRFHSQWMALIDEAAQKIANMLEKLRVRFPRDLSGDFDSYANAVLIHHQKKVPV